MSDPNDPRVKDGRYLPDVALGFVDGKFQSLTPEQYTKAVIQRNADEAAERGEDPDDISDIDEDDGIEDTDVEDRS